MPKHIVSFSGGKDSTAMLLRMLEEGWQVDEIIFCDTGMEFPDMYKHIEQVKDYIGQGITVVCPPKTFEYYMFEHVKVKGKRQGQKGYGWPDFRNRWCTARLKQAPYFRHIKKYIDVVEYQGIAIDEREREQSNAGRNIRYPLIEWGMTEKEALEYCYSKGFTWDGLYERFKRVSCWCCPLKSLPELKSLWKYYPELWEELKEMDKRANNKFRLDYTFEQLEGRFQAEDNQATIFEGGSGEW